MIGCLMEEVGEKKKQVDGFLCIIIEMQFDSLRYAWRTSARTGSPPTYLYFVHDLVYRGIDVIDPVICSLSLDALPFEGWRKRKPSSNPIIMTTTDTYWIAGPCAWLLLRGRIGLPEVKAGKSMGLDQGTPSPSHKTKPKSHALR